MITIPASVGEILDKLTILELKLEFISDPEKRQNVYFEYSELTRTVETATTLSDQVLALRADLKAVNHELWIIEDEIRDWERRKIFGPEFIGLARAVYVTNDKRAQIKKEINIQSGSALVEEKSYQAY